MLKPIMKAAFKLTLPALVAGVMIVAINFADAQQRPFQRRLVGTWTLVSGVTYQGETTSAPLGSRPLGTL
ncbi:MAG: hypothetical protein JO069_03290, partial [Verrucomicrobia bacterium]|nr:hypothetical protein [Verrucomicrobiota bacterium]